MPTVPQLISALESRKWLPPAEVSRLQQLYDAAPAEFGLRVMLKWLVNRGRLTAEQALKIQQAPAGASVHALLDNVLGAGEELQLAPADTPTADVAPPQEDDTKDLMPAEDLEPQQLQLPPRGTPTFAPAGPPPRAPKPEREPLLTAEGKAVGASQVGGYSDLVSELFADDGSSPLAAAPLDGRKRRTRRAGWDSPLMLVGGGLLLVLVLGGAFLLWRIMRHAGDEAFAAAETAYGEGAYARAVELYDQFLTKHSRHLSANRAVVHRGLSHIRLAVEGTRDWAQARRGAAEVLETIAPNEEFGTAHADLGALLPDIAQNLAREALAKNDAALLEEAVAAQQMVEKYLPTSDVLRAKNAATETLLAQARHRLGRDRRAAETAAAMKAAAERGDVVAALRAYSEFAVADSAGASASSVRTALAEVARSAAGGVRFVAEPIQAATDEPAGPALRYVPLVIGGGAPVDGLRGTVTFAVSGGAAFALDGATGDVLWRRTVGFDEILPPQRIGTAADADTVLHDSIRQEFLVVDTRSGALKRRFPVPTGSQHVGERRWASLNAGRLYVTLASGKLYAFDLAGGTSAGYASFPQRLQQAAAVDPRGGVVYQAADDGIVYVLAADGLKPLESGAFGTSGIWSTSPFRVGPHLALFERRGDAGRMLVYETDRDGRNLKPLGEHDFASYVPLPPVALQRFLAAVDLAGMLKVFDFSAADGATPIVSAAEYRSGGGKQLRHLVVQANQLWVAGAQLDRLELQPTLGKLSLIRSYLPAGIATQPATLGAEHAVAVYRDAARRGVSIVALAKTDGREAWRRRLGVPVTAPPLARNDLQVAFTHDSGELTRFDVIASSAKPLGAGVPRPATTVVRDVARVLGAPLATGGDDWALAVELKPTVSGAAPQENPDSGSPRFTILRGGSGALPDIPLKLFGRDPPAEPVAFADGIVVPTALGQVRRLGLGADAREDVPFQPPVVAGSEVAWTRPEVVDGSLVISDRLTHLYRLERQSGPEPALVERAKSPLSHAVAGNLAVIGGAVYAVDAEQRLTSYLLPDLAVGETWPLEGPAAWNGPVAAGRFVFAAATAGDALHCRALDGRGKLLWQATLPAGALPPAAAGDKIFVADSRGTVVRLDTTDGREAARSETGLALVHPPVVDGDQLILSTASGELVWIPQP